MQDFAPLVYDSCNYAPAVERVAEMIDYDYFIRVEQPRLRAEVEHDLHDVVEWSVHDEQSLAQRSHRRMQIVRREVFDKLLLHGERSAANADLSKTVRVEPVSRVAKQVFDVRRV